MCVTWWRRAAMVLHLLWTLTPLLLPRCFLAGLGFTGIAIALLGRNNPVGIAFGALLWSFMDIAKTPLSRADLPREITTIMQGVIVLSVVIAYQVVERVAERREAAITAQATDPDPPADPPGDDAPAPSGVTA